MAKASVHRDRHGTARPVTPFSFSLSVETNDQTGEVMAAYFRVRRGKVAETTELADGAAFADYNRQGELLGIELLAPCEVKVVDRVAKQSLVKRFIRRSAPRAMLVGA